MYTVLMNSEYICVSFNQRLMEIQKIIQMN